MESWKKEIWIAKRILPLEKDNYGNEIETFEKPKKYKMNYQPASGLTTFMQYGAQINDIYRVFVDKKLFQGVIKRFDRVYLSDGDIAEEELKGLVESDNEYCEKANYRVEVVLPQNLKIRIDFKKI